MLSVRSERVTALAGILGCTNILNTLGLFNLEPVPLVKAVLETAQHLLVVDHFPTVEQNVCFSNYLPAEVAGNNERIARPHLSIVVIAISPEICGLSLIPAGARSPTPTTPQVSRSPQSTSRIRSTTRRMLSMRRRADWLR
jgi:hypothetical protein